MPRRLAPAAVSFVLLLGLFVWLFWVPLRPTAWGGPREKGPFEVEEPRGVGRIARDARLVIEQLATFRSPTRALAATAELLLGWHALLVVGRFAVYWWLLRRISGRAWLATLGVLAAALPMLFGGPRHDDWDYGLFLFVILLAATTPNRVPWSTVLFGLPALFIAWANIHASALLGLAWLGTLTLGRILEWWHGRHSGVSERPTVGRLLLALLLCAMAVCATPDGWHIYPDAVRLGKISNNYQLAGWQPINFSTGDGMPWAYLGTLAILLVTQLFTPRALQPTALVVVLTFGFWPVLQQRGLGYWWLIVPWLVASSWRRGPEPEAGARATAPTSVAVALAPASGSGSIDPRLKWAAVGLVVLAIVTTPLFRTLIVGPRSLDTIVTTDTPARLAVEMTTEEPGTHLPAFRDIVQAAYPDQRYRGAVLADPDQGDFLAWVLDGDNTRPVMIYSRPEAIDPAVWADAVTALNGASDWWEILGRHQVNLIVVHPTRREKLVERLRHSAEWAIVEDAPVRLVAVRRAPKLPAELQP